MGASKPLRLRALANKLDRLLLPQLEQILIIITGLSHICDLDKPENLPKKNFGIKPCPRSDIEDVDEGLSTKGIDFFGQYDPGENVVTIYMCRIIRFVVRHGFHVEDVVTIVSIHELAHFVTHLGKSDSSKCWVAFGQANEEALESSAQQLTNLYHSLPTGTQSGSCDPVLKRVCV
jgi:hypothetical protein